MKERECKKSLTKRRKGGRGGGEGKRRRFVKEKGSS